MRVLGIAVAVVMALTIQTTFARALVGATVIVDLVLVAVVYFALANGPGTGLVVGSVAGLVQDSLSSGVLGIGGLAKCIVGFAAGSLGQQFIVTALVPRLVMLAAATCAHGAIFMGLYAVLGLRTFASPWQSIAWQTVGNMVVGMVVFTIVEGLPGVVERRRATRRSRPVRR